MNRLFDSEILFFILNMNTWNGKPLQLTTQLNLKFEKAYDF